MADTRSGVPEMELVPRASVPAAEYAEYKVLRHKLPASVLGQLDPAIRARTVVTMDGLLFPVKFRNQGAMEEWWRLFTAHAWSRRVWDDWGSARATCLDCINELCWLVDQHLERHSRYRRPPCWAHPTLAIRPRAPLTSGGNPRNSTPTLDNDTWQLTT